MKEMEEFILKGEYIKLCKLMKAADLISNGSDAKFEIMDGNVKVNFSVDEIILLEKMEASLREKDLNNINSEDKITVKSKYLN